MNKASHSDKINYIFLTILLIFSFLFSICYLESVNKWWFEDDPYQFTYASKIVNPIDIFISRKIMTGMGTGKALVPMQFLSYWADVKLAGYLPLFAYIHNFVSFLLTALFLYLVIQNFTHNRLASLSISCLWILLPSTIATHHFLATRHYIEGFLFSLMAIYLAQKTCKENKGIVTLMLIGLLSFVAMIHKEVYATALPTFLFLYAISQGHYKMAIIPIVLSIGYAIYRLWAVGSDFDYTIPLLDFRSYIKFLLHLPFTFSANIAGLVLYFGLFFLCGYSLYSIKATKRIIFLFATLFIVSVATIYPVSLPVLNSALSPGTWYRAVFVLNTILLVFGSYILTQYYNKRIQAFALVIALVIIIPSTEKTRVLWDNMMTHAKKEGMFYLYNPDKLLYSEEDAFWFIPGVHYMYEVRQAHYINKQYTNNEHAQEMLNKFSTIWRYKDGDFFSDDRFYIELLEENNLIKQ